MTAITSALQVIPLQADPFNAETPLEALAEPLTPTCQFYVRNHFEIPEVDPTVYRLQVGGEVERAIQFTLDDLQQMREQHLVITMECAGNGRATLSPRPAGVPWSVGAVGTARFTGTPLRLVLDEAGLKPDAMELLFVGADRGVISPGRAEPFARSLPRATAHHPDTLLAWAMNDDPLTPDHGYPLRLVVPQWYGVASVKWLVQITALARPFDGYFQREQYCYLGNGDDGERLPLTRMRVRSVIATPADESEVLCGEVEVAGTAWSGSAPVRSVLVSADGGKTWDQAELGLARSAYSATPWRLRWTPPSPGRHTLLARAQDSAGHIQPLEQAWNCLGYGNNAAHQVEVTVLPR